MNALVMLALLGWIPVVVTIFGLMPPRLAVITGFIGAWLFLPVAGYTLPGLPDYDKTSAACLGILLGTALFDTERLVSFRPRWLDLPLALFILVPIASSLSNGLGLYDGLAISFKYATVWGLPFLIGRLYFSDLQGMRLLMLAIFLGGLIYVPLCWLEIRLSPQLHKWVYGFYQHQFAQTIRLGGFRPTVFMQHGLMVGMWMTAATLAGVWLVASRSLPPMPVLPRWAYAGVLALTALAVKSSGALVLLVLGLVVLYAAQRFRLRWVAVALLLLAPLYASLRLGQVAGSERIVEAAAVFSPDRAQSLSVRLRQEDEWADLILQRPVFGWGTWIPDGRDQLYLLYARYHGLFGIACWMSALLLPAAVFIRKAPPQYWRHPHLAPAAIAATLTCLYAIDCTLNGMINPVFVLVCGGLAGLVSAMPVLAASPPAEVKRRAGVRSRAAAVAGGFRAPRYLAGSTT